MNKKILIVASEALPYAASGGLGDVIGSLPRALKEKDAELDVRVIMPLYSVMADKYREKLEEVCITTVPLSWRQQYCGLYKLTESGVTFYFVDNMYYFARTGLYGSMDDAERYAFFCKAVCELMPRMDFYPDILHAHDWQSALSVIYLKRKYAHRPEYSGIKTIFTIHNIEYQGQYGFDILGDTFELDEWDRDVVEYGGCINLMKGAIVCADKVTTVSPQYSKEILSETFSHGLHYVLIANQEKLSGIINGIDYDYYNPQTDPDVEVNFTARSIGRKAQNRKMLREMVGLPEKDVPMIAMITRLTGHKGLDLVTWAADELLQRDVQLVILGTGDKHYEDFFKSLADRYPDKVATILKFDKALSKKIYASADLFLMPSKSEPCGLSQMIASRYGAVPIVRLAGGLADTIHEPDNGFTFYAYNGSEMLRAIERALASFENKDEWASLVKRVMKTDFTWANSANQYLGLYESV